MGCAGLNNDTQSGCVRDYSITGVEDDSLALAVNTLGVARIAKDDRLIRHIVD